MKAKLCLTAPDFAVRAILKKIGLEKSTQTKVNGPWMLVYLSIIKIIPEKMIMNIINIMDLQDETVKWFMDGVKSVPTKV